MSHLPRPSLFAPFSETLTPIHPLFDALGPFSDLSAADDDDPAAFTLNLLERLDRPSSPFGSDRWSPSLQIGGFAAPGDPDFMDSDDPSLDLGLGSVASASDSFDSRDAFDPPPYDFQEDPAADLPWIAGELEEIGGVVEEVVELEEVASDVEMGYGAEQAPEEALDSDGACDDVWRDIDALGVDIWGDAEGVEVDAWCDAGGVEVEAWDGGDGDGGVEAEAEASGDAEGLDEDWWGEEAETDHWGEDMWREVEEVEAEVWEVLMGWDGDGDGDDGRLQDLFDDEFTEAIENIVAGEASTSGRRPAAQSVLNSLPSVVVAQGEEGEKTICAVCKDEVADGGVLKRLPCSHGYHEECILPWLRMRNTCPVCRFELPTDDPGYEARRAVREGRDAPGDRATRALEGINSMLHEFIHDVLGADQSR